MKIVRAEGLSFLKRVFLVDLIKGLMLTFSYQRPSENYTEQYPKVRPKVAERYRGAPRLNNDPVTGATLCIACNLCALACPEYCIEVAWERTEAGKKALTTFTFDLSRCMFCGLCEDACPTPCLELTQDFELALYGRADMKWDRQKLEEGNQPVVYTK
jgi:NADH-quinone oxidoreductase subunit I